MQNISNIPMETDEQRAAYRALRDDLRLALEALENQYSEDLRAGNTPSNTIHAYLMMVGADMARSVIATLVNQSAWDGRISDRNAAWAAGIENAWDADSANRMSIYTNRIHMAHLDQMADAMRKAA